MSHDADSQQQGLPEAEHHRYGRILLAVTLAGALFLAGQGVRWWQEHTHARRMQQAVHEVYQRALAGEPGRSPYGRLQFELGKLKAQSAQRLDMVELLAALSRRAPEGVRILGINMATASGVVSGLAATPEDFRRYQTALAAEAYFTFSVRKADTMAQPVRFELDVKARDRSAPPKGTTSELEERPWQCIARLTHLTAPAQRRLWRMLILAWALLLTASWAGLSAFTRVEEKAAEEAGQTYVSVAPLAAEVMDLRQRRGQLESQPPLLAAEQVAKNAGVGPERLRIQILAGPAPALSSGAAAQTLSLRAQSLALRELVELLRDLKVEAGLTTLSAHLTPTPGNDNRMDLDLVLSR